ILQIHLAGFCFRICQHKKLSLLKLYNAEKFMIQDISMWKISGDYARFPMSWLGSKLGMHDERAEQTSQ
ncbi:hypothetical protein, partial [Salmonella sp. s55044]|uniref:hypothetical protein n=1 Tax=Salmonella sp. s55044 TaxID=3159677 RepID=UPI00397EF519